jgi:UDP-N-acetyl-D-glucosamine dehydrogenase
VSDLASVDAVFICVPTPYDAAHTPDLSFVRNASATVASILRKGMLVVLQSTTYPGTTTDVVRPILESSGLVAGRDFNLAFSPERVDPGNQTWTIKNTPKVVGGLTPACGKRAKVLLDALIGDPSAVKVLSSPAAAEMTKLLENTYRTVNIALVNEMAMLSHEMGVDIWEIVDAAKTKPFGFQAFYPGVGPGGHCIPVDPYFLAWRARELEFQTKFIELAADTNLRMANYVTTRIQAFLDQHGKTVNGARILALGAAFKPDVSDVRNSRAIRVMELLKAAGARLEFADPGVESIELDGQQIWAVEVTKLAPGAWKKWDAVVFLVAHSKWPVARILNSGALIFDAVNATDGRRAQRLERL